jgi:peptide/nickel transport system substrate-binding protein
MKKKTRKWWEKFGKPEYGGELVIRANNKIVNFDPYDAPSGNIHSAWMERLVSCDWTLDPAVFDFLPHWHPSQYMKGCLAESWEFTDPGTYVAHLRKGIHWQNIPPANGREFNADDVVFHYQRMCGMGNFSKPSQQRAPAFQELVSVTAADQYTVIFKWNVTNKELILETMHQISPAACLENPEAVKKWGDLNDWHHAVGTGPYMLKEFLPGGAATLVKNPDYWGHDERYPLHKLPYIDTVKFILMANEAEAIEAMRQGKLDIIDHISPKQAYAIQKTNPEILQITHPDSNAASIEPRNDTTPFNDIRVRKAMQMAIDLPALAKEYFEGTIEPYPSTLTSRYMTGWGFPYEEWPQDLKDEYAYNPPAAKKLLAEAGYSNGFTTNIVVDAAADLGMIQIIKSYFAAVGIDMEIRIMATGQWINFVLVGHKHDQLAHRTGGPLGHTSAPNRDLTLYQKGVRSNWAMVDDPVFEGFLPKVLVAKDLEETRKIVKEANEYVARQHFSISLLQPRAHSLCQPWVKGFSGQFGSAWAHGGGPAMLSFYLPRFWIDQKMKKAMGL